MKRDVLCVVVLALVVPFVAFDNTGGWGVMRGMAAENFGFPPSPYHEPGPDLRAMLAKISPSLVVVRAVSADGSRVKSIPGLVIGPDSLIVIATDEVDPGMTFSVCDDADKPRHAQVIATDRDVGCIVLLADGAKPRPSIQFADSDAVMVGDEVRSVNFASIDRFGSPTWIGWTIVKSDPQGSDIEGLLHLGPGGGDLRGGVLLNENGDPIGMMRSDGHRLFAVPGKRLEKVVAGIRPMEDAEPGVGADSR